MTRRRIPGVAGRSIVALVALVALASCGDEDSTTITVRHGEVPAPTYLDGGDPGPSAGDVRIFHLDGETNDGELVTMNWVMTTTATNEPAADVESRFTIGSFVFGDGTDDQFVLEGLAFYPGEQATLDVSSTVRRALVGGAGRFAGVHGEVVSTRLEDGTWTHVFTFED